MSNNKIINKETGHAFHNLGKALGMEVGIRFWAMPSLSKSDACYLGFRVRIVPSNESSATILDFKLYASSIFSGAEWSGYSEKHVSLTYGLIIEQPLPCVPEILDFISSKNCVPAIIEYISNDLKSIEITATEDELLNYIGDALSEASYEILAPSGKSNKEGQISNVVPITAKKLKSIPEDTDVLG
jgi:hypothetical protein